ncbi:hypothetical protein K0B96_02320 [Horticoccus luteus]|uniref:Uncharacterized protein n=1 Tax=Horticoccus luteus TaxID=2862869 RepID=A0A8F9TXR0_9BACT|nr:hypothetical protein [Horticoccus luteus]QYM79472.1 hypothetical protein K0B96_02320 [Horticoccus luteus]
MNQETVTYLTNIVIGVILGALATNYWRQRRYAPVLTAWVVAAWVLTAADILFAARQVMSPGVGRLLPTLCVTLGHAVLFIGAQKTAGRTTAWPLLAGVMLAHAAGLIAFLVSFEASSNFRMAFNGLIWGGLSVACGLSLRRSPGYFWRPAFAPAQVFFAHAGFHAARVLLAVLAAHFEWPRTLLVLQVAGDLEVSFFMVALFVGLLVANLQVQHEELMRTRAEVDALSGLLPICAWCKKIRDDEGYWQQVESYFGRRSGVRFTHGVCLDCMGKVADDVPGKPVA